jgi:hypothetical protein
LNDGNRAFAALLEGLTESQDDEQFNARLDASIEDVAIERV